MLRRTKRRRFIEQHEFSPTLRRKLRDELGDSRQAELALGGLREWYLVCLEAKGEVLGMPSRVVDVAWHEMILMTRSYHAFCRSAFGHYLHHHPEETSGESMGIQLARTLHVLDRRQTRAGGTAAGLPFLFAIDAQAGLADGHLWTMEDVSGLRRTVVERATPQYAFAGAGGCGGGGGDGGGGGGCGGGGCGGGG